MTAKGKLLRIHNQTLALPPNAAKQAALKISLSQEEVTKFKSAKAFVWDANTLRPLTSVVLKQDMFGDTVETLTKAAIFDGFDVGLKGDSYFKEQLETGAKYLKYYEPDRLAASCISIIFRRDHRQNRMVVGKVADCPDIP